MYYIVRKEEKTYFCTKFLIKYFKDMISASYFQCCESVYCHFVAVSILNVLWLVVTIPHTNFYLPADCQWQDMKNSWLPQIPVYQKTVLQPTVHMCKNGIFCTECNPYTLHYRQYVTCKHESGGHTKNNLLNTHPP